ncbi:hypothetical protein [Nostoc sp.]
MQIIPFDRSQVFDLTTGKRSQIPLDTGLSSRQSSRIVRPQLDGTCT